VDEDAATGYAVLFDISSGVISGACGDPYFVVVKYPCVFINFSMMEGLAIF
jgi:hypothetical protein